LSVIVFCSVDESKLIEKKEIKEVNECSVLSAVKLTLRVEALNVLKMSSVVRFIIKLNDVVMTV